MCSFQILKPAEKKQRYQYGAGAASAATAKDGRPTPPRNKKKG